MSFKVGDKVLLASDLADPTRIIEKTVTKVSKDTVQCGSAEETYYIAFLWPARVKDELTRILEERAALKKIYDDSMGMIYDLKNRIGRSEI